MTNGERGAPENNGNAETHGLYSQRDKLFERLSDDEKKLVVDISQDLLDKFDGEVGAYERNAIRNIALDQVKRIRANEHIIAEDLITDGSERTDRINMAYDRLVRTSTKEMEKLGLLEEGPEMKKAEATQDWMEQISDAKDEASDD
ncbi:hypothetical protein G6M89_09205 [Natronolimnobius sp. AArcel1]|uniref:hypothetical protein n=1 Tax=Natronolimnobius sp. AArcel1 TaxID=1679093 RepID=UPI0013ED8B66|nr:hypothetical protein [Natronolimnobius sp. AArcel1]NGM69181.1 hypothetical protein [Natronolimnobius sp. AArcel1]